MVRFDVSIDIGAPPTYVADWWLDYAAEDKDLAPGMARRKVERVDANTIRLSTLSEFGGNVRTTVGTVTRTGPTRWHMTAHVSSGGKVVSTTQTSYSVDGAPGGSRLLAEFEFVGRSIPWRIALLFARFSLRRDRLRAFRAYADAIGKGFRAGLPAVAPPAAEPPPPA
ncbi:MAG TPA: hypothetical protein VMF04_00880 [Thermoplasmata archaeon]|nr:hypothetical protein [Thermoplasmata archaeon]